MKNRLKIITVCAVAAAIVFWLWTCVEATVSTKSANLDNEFQFQLFCVQTKVGAQILRRLILNQDRKVISTLLGNPNASVGPIFLGGRWKSSSEANQNLIFEAAGTHGILVVSIKNGRCSDVCLMDVSDLRDYTRYQREKAEKIISLSTGHSASEIVSSVGMPNKVAKPAEILSGEKENLIEGDTKSGANRREVWIYRSGPNIGAYLEMDQGKCINSGIIASFLQPPN